MKGIDASQFGVLIPFIHNISLLQHCLDAIKQTSECIIHVCCDNPSLSADAVAVCSNYDAHVICNDQWLGYTRTINKLCGIAQEPFIVFCNSDVVVTPGWLECLHKSWSNINKPGVVSIKTISMRDKSVNFSGVSFGSTDIICLWRHSFPNHNLSFGLRSFQAVSDCCALIEHSTYDQVGPHDEKYLVSWSDLDLCLALQEKGYSNACCGDSAVYHYEHVSNDHRFLLEDSSKTYFFSKWKGVIKVDTQDWLSISYTDMKHKKHLIGLEANLCLFMALFDEDIYIRAIEEAFTVSFSDIFRFPLEKSQLCLHSCLTSELAECRKPIVYLFRSYRTAWDNKLWFDQRRGRGDVIVDYVGNAIIADCIC